MNVCFLITVLKKGKSWSGTREATKSCGRVAILNRASVKLLKYNLFGTKLRMNY